MPFTVMKRVVLAALLALGCGREGVVLPGGADDDVPSTDITVEDQSPPAPDVVSVIDALAPVDLPPAPDRAPLDLPPPEDLGEGCGATGQTCCGFRCEGLKRIRSPTRCDA